MILVLGMSAILGNIYDRSITIVFGTVFFSTFWRLWKLDFWQKNFSKSYIYVFFLSGKQQNWFQKKFRNLGVVGHRKLPNQSLSNVFNLLLIGLPYTLSFEWPGFELKYLVTVTQKGQPPKFRASVRNYSISQAKSKCNTLFRHAGSNWVIIMELKRKVECSWECTFWAS